MDGLYAMSYGVLLVRAAPSDAKAHTTALGTYNQRLGGTWVQPEYPRHEADD